MFDEDVPRSMGNAVRKVAKVSEREVRCAQGTLVVRQWRASLEEPLLGDFVVEIADEEEVDPGAEDKRHAQPHARE
jgi:hypothetical protein